MRRFVAAFALVAAALAAASARGLRAQPALPDGPGRALVESACTRCHGVDRIARSGYDRAGWSNVVAMMRNAGAQLPADRVDAVVDYLAASFPPKPAPEAVLLPGAARVTIREWAVPTAGSRPHDPFAAPDGSIWYTGQMANVLGRLDPLTGAFREFRPPVADSGPHGLVMDAAGDVWFTANFQGYIGRLDPRTGTFTRYPLPDPNARDPHTLLFDAHGILWFTVQSADMVGRLDPRGGEVKLVRVPTPRANPYGMAIAPDGVPWFAEFGANKLASIDPRTLAIREHVLPNAEARPRRIALAHGAIWYTDYARGYLGRFDLATEAVREWPSPGGPGSRPYGIAFTRGAVWYSESGVRPNTLVRFDPAAHRFQSWAIPSGGGVVRNMSVTRDGDLALACSGENRVALATIR